MKGKVPLPSSSPPGVHPGSSYACAGSSTPSSTHISAPCSTAMGSRYASASVTRYVTDDIVPPSAHSRQHRIPFTQVLNGRTKGASGERDRVDTHLPIKQFNLSSFHQDGDPLLAFHRGVAASLVPHQDPEGPGVITTVILEKRGAQREILFLPPLPRPEVLVWMVQTRLVGAAAHSQHALHMAGQGAAGSAPLPAC